MLYMYIFIYTYITYTYIMERNRQRHPKREKDAQRDEHTYTQGRKNMYDERQRMKEAQKTN